MEGDPPKNRLFNTVDVELVEILLVELVELLGEVMIEVEERVLEGGDKTDPIFSPAAAAEVGGFAGE